MSLAPADAGREVGRVVDGGNPGIDFDFVVTPQGLVTTGWYDDGPRPAPDERLVMAWVDRDPSDDVSPTPGVGDTPNDVAAITIDAYERTVTVDGRTWTLDGLAAEYPPTGMPRIAHTFDGGFIARYDQVANEYLSIVVRGWPDGTVDEWAVPAEPETAWSIVPEPMGTVLVAYDDWYVRAAPFGSPRRWDDGLDVDIETGTVDVTGLNDHLAALDPSEVQTTWGLDPIAFAAAAIGMPISPNELVTIDHVRSTDTAETVNVTTERFFDDSVYATRWTLTIRPDLTGVDTIEWTNSCQPGRGHQDFQSAFCA